MLFVGDITFVDGLFADVLFVDDPSADDPSADDLSVDVLFVDNMLTSKHKSSQIMVARADMQVTYRSNIDAGHLKPKSGFYFGLVFPRGRGPRNA